MAQERPIADWTRLSLTMKPGAEQAKPFFPLLRPGFSVRAKVGCSIRELLCDQFGLSPDYLKSRITTIFLNHKAIDDPETSLVGDDATLALSAAMPGLVGATMRCGGFYAAMRSHMSYHGTDGKIGADRGEVRVKLFNLLMPELGPGFLLRGVKIPSRDLADFLLAQDADFWHGCSKALLNGQAADLDSLKRGEGLPAGEDPVELSVIFEE